MAFNIRLEYAMDNWSTRVLQQAVSSGKSKGLSKTGAYVLVILLSLILAPVPILIRILAQKVRQRRAIEG